MYNFDEVINRRGTNSSKWDTFDPELLPMWVADMDFAAPPPVIKALKERIDHGIFGYGIPGELPAIICDWMLKEYGASVEEEWIVLLPAIVPALRVLCRLREGPPLINTPNYNVLLDAPNQAGKDRVLVPLKNSNEHYTIDYDLIKERLSSSTKLFFLCNPHNPVGRVYTREELLELSRFAREHDLLVVSDEVHCGLVYEGAHIPWFTVDDYARDRSVTLMGPGKTFNLPGLSLGAAIIPNPELRKEFTGMCYPFSSPTVLSACAAEAAFRDSQDWHRELVNYLRGNRDYLENRLSSFGGCTFTHTEGTYLQWIDFRPLGMEEPFQWLQEHPKILASDGLTYGSDGYVRLNFGCPRSVLEGALDRIEESLREQKLL